MSREKIISKSKQRFFGTITRIFFFEKSAQIKSGEYLLRDGESFFDLLKKFQRGDVHYRKITFAEGLSKDTILKIIAQVDELLDEIPAPEGIDEGSLLPETYLYTYGETKSGLVERMQKSMTDFFNTEWEKRAKDLPFTKKEEALSLASIVEKETGLKDERGKVASVFVNRLRKGWRLQSDPTVIYSFAKGDKSLERTIYEKDLRKSSEYNTYTLDGIPQKPIANPGRDAIRATLNPEKTDYMFFVATGNGGHNFSKTLAEHNDFVKKYREIIKKGRENKGE
jgi:UPF0755 protein